jgi:hypothetical protein
MPHATVTPDLCHIAFRMWVITVVIYIFTAVLFMFLAWYVNTIDHRFDAEIQEIKQLITDHHHAAVK